MKKMSAVFCLLFSCSPASEQKPIDTQIDAQIDSRQDATDAGGSTRDTQRDPTDDGLSIPDAQRDATRDVSLVLDAEPDQSKTGPSLAEPGDEGDTEQLWFSRPKRFSVYSTGAPSLGNGIDVFLFGRLVDDRPDPGLRVRWMSESDWVWSDWQDVDNYNDVSGNWDVLVTVTKRGRIHFNIETTNGPYYSTTRRDFAVGITIIALGQSNLVGQTLETYLSLAGGEMPSHIQPSPNIVAENNWLGALIARMYVDQNRVLGFSKRAGGNLSLSAFQPGQTSGDYLIENAKKMLEPTETALNNAEGWGGVDCVLFHIGETDAKNGESTAQMKTWIYGVINGLAAQGVDPAFFFAVTPLDIASIDDQAEQNIRDAYAEVAAELSNFYVVDIAPSVTDDTPANPSHIYYDETVQTAVDIIFPALESALQSEGY